MVVLAQDEARRLDCGYIDVDHLLLGMLAEDEGMAAKALKTHGLTLESLRLKVEEVNGRGERPPTAHIPFTVKAKEVLNRALREALEFGHSYIGTEHLLCGLIYNQDAEPLFISLGIDSSELRRTVVRLMGEPTSKSQPTQQRPADEPAMPAKKQLIIDLNALGLEEQVERVHQWRQELGPDHPDYKLGLARFLEMAARRLRKQSAAG